MVDTVKEIGKVTYDSIFKKVFSSKENRKVISYLISNITKIDYFYIYDNFKYGNTELLKKKYSDKGKLTRLEKMLVMMQLNDREKLRQIARRDEVLMIFGKSIEQASEEIGVYDKEAADEFVRQIDMADAEEKGTKRGVKQGIVQIAKNILKENMNVADIAKLTGLNQKEITRLANNL